MVAPQSIPGVLHSPKRHTVFLTPTDNSNRMTTQLNIKSPFNSLATLPILHKKTTTNIQQKKTRKKTLYQDPTSADVDATAVCREVVIYIVGDSEGPVVVHIPHGCLGIQGLQCVHVLGTHLYPSINLHTKKLQYFL